jgi:hypothetical protein
LEADYQKRSRNKQELEKPKYDQYEWSHKILLDTTSVFD